MESGAKAEVVRNGIEMVVKGLGAETIAVRIGYASISLTVRDGGDAGQTPFHAFCRWAHHGVNLQLNNAARALAVRASQGSLTPEAIVEEVAGLRKKTPKHHWVTVALATGSCLRLLWSIARYRCNGVSAHLVCWLHRPDDPALHGAQQTECVQPWSRSSPLPPRQLGALISQLVGSITPEMAMFASVLLLVPGVPSMNAQTDIMEGSTKRWAAHEP